MIRISLVTVVSFKFERQKQQTMSHENEAAQGNDAEDDPLGNIEGRRDLEAHKIGELCAIEDHDTEKDQGKDVHRNGREPFERAGHSRGQDVYSGMDLSPVGHGGPQKSQPDQEETGQFFRPEKGMVQYVAEKDLDRNGYGH